MHMYREADVLVPEADLELLLPHAVRLRPLLVILPRIFVFVVIVSERVTK